MTNKSIINWFRIQNWRELSFHYRLVDVQVDGAGNDKKILNRAFMNAKNHLAFATRGPVSIVRKDGKRFIAVSGDAVLKKQIITGAPLNVTLTPVEDTFTLNFTSLKTEDLELAVDFVENAFRRQFSSNNQLWAAGTSTFVKKDSLRRSEEINSEIFHGFRFKIVALDVNNVFACVDLAYRYSEKINLHEKLKRLPKERHQDVVSNQNFLYMNGDDWYVIKGKALGNRIDKHMMPHEDRQVTVLEYNQKFGKYSRARRKAPLLPASETLLHTYSNSSKSVFCGAACLAKAIRKAEDEIHRVSINDPNARFRRIELHVKNYFQTLKLNGKDLIISTTPLEKELQAFSLPALKYGNNAVLDPYHGTVPYGNVVDHFPKRRREFIFNNGIIPDSGFSPQYIFISDEMPLGLAKGLKFYADKMARKIAPQFPGFEIHQFSVKGYPFASKVYVELRDMIAQKNLAGGNAIFILPDYKDGAGHFIRDLHHIIKKELFNEVRIKCVSGEKLKSFLKPVVLRNGHTLYSVAEKNVFRFKPYLANTIFELLIINRKWPYALAENLHHDLYIGIDAHDFYAGFVFFFKNGEKIVFDLEKVARNTGTFRNEKINFKVIEDKIFLVLSRHLRTTGDKPRSIVILRDGVSFGEEDKALCNALKRLEQEGLLDTLHVSTGVIDVAKSSAMPVRAASFLGNTNSLMNPVCGTHLYADTEERNAFIFNTGAPYQVDGSSNPIQVTHSSGNIDFKLALEDIFRLTQITFSSPDRPTSLPLPLKLIDTLIRDVAHENDYAFTQQSEIKIYEPSLN